MNYVLKPCSYSLIVLGVLACKPTDQPVLETKNTETVVIVSKPKIELDCHQIEQKFKNLNGTGSVDDLISLNQLVKQCLPKVKLSTRYYLMGVVEQGYDTYFKTLPASLLSFLAYEQQTSDKAEIQKEFKALRQDQQYFIKNMQKIYIDNYYLGEGDWDLTLHPQYDIDIFRPYLPQADQVYLDRIRQEYIGTSPSREGGILNTFNEVADYLLFWQNFKVQYPNSHFENAVESNITEHLLTLFRGNVPRWDSPFNSEAHDSDTLKDFDTALIKVTKSPDAFTKKMAYMAIKIRAEQDSEIRKQQVQHLEDCLHQKYDQKSTP